MLYRTWTTCPIVFLLLLNKFSHSFWLSPLDQLLDQQKTQNEVVTFNRASISHRGSSLPEWDFVARILCVNDSICPWPYVSSSLCVQGPMWPSTYKISKVTVCADIMEDDLVQFWRGNDLGCWCESPVLSFDRWIGNGPVLWCLYVIFAEFKS